jgi:hypothetical protein
MERKTKVYFEACHVYAHSWQWIFHFLVLLLAKKIKMKSVKKYASSLG